MKKYVVPSLACVELRVEERIASNCNGSCSTDQIAANPTTLFANVTS